MIFTDNTAMLENKFFLSLLYMFIMYIIGATLGLKLTKLVVPTYTLKGDQAQLECIFELGEETLYSVQWYKENEEFFRYVPKSSPPVHSYKVEGIEIDHKNSTSNKVTLKGVTLNSSGVYRCEVSAEAPSFSSAQNEARMEVVSLPTSGPHISGERSEYQIDDQLNLNCTSGKSRPPPSLDWFINGKQVENNDLVPYPDQKSHHGLISSILGLRLTIRNDHFINGSMQVKCVAAFNSSSWKSEKQSTLQRIDNREALLLVKNSSDKTINSHFILILLTSIFYLCIQNIRLPLWFSTIIAGPV